MLFTIYLPITCVVLVDFKAISYGVPPSKMFRKKKKQRGRDYKWLLMGLAAQTKIRCDPSESKTLKHLANI